MRGNGLSGEPTLSLLEDTLDGARAASTGHLDVELVVVVGHSVYSCEMSIVVRGSQRLRGSAGSG